MLSLQEIEVFLMVVDTGSFSKAGQNLHLSQPTVSQIIQTLETRFAVPLFERHRRGVFLTDAGEALVPMAHELMTTAFRLEETMARIHGGVVGKLQVGCSTSTGKYLLPRLIAQFRQQYPDVRVDVVVKSRETVFDRLISGLVDFGVSSKIMEHSDLDYSPFFDDEIILIVPPKHAWAKFGRILPDDLLDAPIILRENTSGTFDSLNQSLRDHDLRTDMLNVVMELGNAEAIAMAVEEGIGVAFVSRQVGRRSAEHGKVKEVEVQGMTPLLHHIYIARNLRIPLSRSQAEFWQHIQTTSPTLLNPK